MYLKQAIDSIINQSLDFEDNIQIIIVNDGSVDGTEDICIEYKVKYPQNIKYITNPYSFGPAFARNQGLKEAKGKYINFLDSDDYVSSRSFLDVYRFFEHNYDEVDVVAIPIFYFGSKKGDHPLNFKFKKDRIINLLEEPENIQLSAPSSFFKAEAIKNLKFNTNLHSSEDALFVNQTLLNKMKLGVVSRAKYYYRKKESKTSLLDISSLKKEFYTSRLEDFHIQLIKDSIKKYNNVLKFIQHVIMYDLEWIFKIERVDQILTKDEIKKLYKTLNLILQYIDDSVIFNQKYITNQLKAHILFVKYLNDSYLTSYSDFNLSNEKRELFKDILIDNLELNQVILDIFEIEDDYIYVSGLVTTFFNKEVDLYILVNGERIDTKKLYYPQRDRYSLNFSYCYNHNFEAYIPINSNNLIISFKCDAYGPERLVLEFNRPCRLSNVSKYLLTKNHISRIKDNQIIVKPRKVARLIKNEFLTLSSMLKKREQGWRTGVIFRILFFILYPFVRSSRIWLFMDLPYLADDNGIQLFKYAVKQDDDIEKVFVLRKDNFAFNDISKIGKTIAYGSIKHRMYCLFAEKVISSHPDNSLVYPFWGNYPFLSGLVRFRLVFLQHGITKDNVSMWLNKADKNISLIVTSSEEEYKSFFKFPYNYHEDVIRLLGFPRFDYLKKGEDFKEIIIMPSWRRYLHYSPKEDVLKSNFFLTYNKLINDDRLINLCKKYGYKLIFKPHPNVYRFIDLFEKNDYVKIDSKENKYNYVFNHSSLIVTDYSSTAFDFAYLEKPVIYYHYASDYHFDLNESYFDYETMGFGEVVDNHTDLVDLIIEYIRNDCKMKDKYVERVHEYFTFNDRNNCKRVYYAIKKLNYDY